MEERPEKNRFVITFAITGPESTGKTLISEFLGKKLNGLVIPEYARDYLSGKNGKYSYKDIEIIGRMQINQRKTVDEKKYKIVILDTWLIITKIWFIEVYGKYPGWIDKAIQQFPVDLYLLCKPDIPWIHDPLRENGGEKRKYLYNRYLEEINQIKIPVGIVSGTYKQRLDNAFEIVKSHIIK